MFTLEFSVAGDVQLERSLSRFGDRVKDLRSPFREIVQDFHKGEKEQFDSEGRSGSGGWAPLKPATIEEKQRRGFPLDILVRTGDLRDSLQGKGSHAVEEIRPLFLRMGTDLPYAVFHQKGARTMPARPPIQLTEAQKTRWLKYIHTYLVLEAGKVEGV